MTHEHLTITADELAALIATRDETVAERDALRCKREAWQTERAELRGELRVTKVERDLVKEQLKIMLRKLFGASSEKKRDPRQGELFLNEADKLASATQSRRRKTGRRSSGLRHEAIVENGVQNLG